MSCLTCGREEGHYLNCESLFREHARNLVEPDFVGAMCAVDGCHNPRYSAHPRVKFCEEHRDPKSRKE